MQNKQILVKFKDKNQGEKFIEFLEQKGFTNVHNTTYDKLRVKVLVIDTSTREFFGTNITCLAGLASCDIKPVSIDDFYSSYEF